MDNTFVGNFNGDVQVAKAYALPQINEALSKMNTLFYFYKLNFNLIFFPTNTLAPPYPGDVNTWINQINNFADNTFPCISRDCIVVLTTSFSTGGGHGHSRVALVSSFDVPTYLIAHEIGHNLGLIHPTANCYDDCMPSTFMCGSQLISFNNCDYQRLSDQDDGVFSQVNCNPCHCNLWADVADPLPDYFDCSQEPSVSMASDQPFLVENCLPDRSLAMYSVTVRGGAQGVANATLRIRYLDEIYDWDAAIMGVDFDESLPPNNPVNDPYHQLIMKNGTQELVLNLAVNEEQTFFFKLLYNPDAGVDPANNLKPVVTARLSYPENNVTKIKNSKVFPKAFVPLTGNVTLWPYAGQPTLIYIAQSGFERIIQI